MSDTPRTDIMVTGNSDPTQDEYEDLANWARQLELELQTQDKREEKLVEENVNLSNMKSDLERGLDNHSDALEVGQLIIKIVD